MSYMRWGYPLKYFKGESKSYVYGTSDKPHRGCITDYSDDYEDNASFCELIGDIIARETGDNAYAEKIMRILAKKLKIEDRLRKKPLSTEQLWKLTEKKLKKFEKSEVWKKIKCQKKK